jgi:hypothetical protein
MNYGDGCGRCSHRVLRHAGRDHDQAVLGHCVLMTGHGYLPLPNLWRGVRDQ